MAQDATFKYYLELITLLVGLSAFIYQLARLEGKIFAAIDKSGDEIFGELSKQNSRLSIHLAECQQKEKNFNYCIRELRKMIDEIKEKKEK